MRVSLPLALFLIAVFSLSSPAHVGTPPTKPVGDEVAPVTVLASDAACNIVGTSWCVYSVRADLKCKKNGTAVTLTMNSTTTNWPHAYHLDKTWNVNLTTLGLVSGDTLTWEFSTWATSGPDANVKVYVYKTTQVQ